jgi:hypothetical protein
MTGEEAAAPADGTLESTGTLPFDTSKAHQARIYDYLLGGKDNYAADRAAAEAVIKVWPDMPFTPRANRAFLGRAVRYLAADAGIRQFLDIGTGIPTAGNTHQVAQAIAPESRVVYADYDPIVLAHARALLTSGDAGATDYIHADLRDTGVILAGASQLLDFAPHRFWPPPGAVSRFPAGLSDPAPTMCAWLVAWSSMTSSGCARTAGRGGCCAPTTRRSCSVSCTGSSSRTTFAPSRRRCSRAASTTSCTP